MKDPALKFLVVEDSPSLAILYKTVLEAKGHQVTVTHNGKEELEVYEKELKYNSGKIPFDLVISDNSMPEISGIVAGRKILSMAPKQKFFFVTGEKDAVLKSFYVDGKNIDVEQKPISTELFIKKVELITQN